MNKIDTTGWLTFDLECNMGPDEGKGFYRRANKMICVVTKEVSTGEVKIYEPGQEKEMLEALLTAPRLVAHHGRGFDIPALGNIFPEHNKALRMAPMVDTLLQSRQEYSFKQLAEFDKKHGHPEDRSLHGLKAWGYRFGSNKIQQFSDVDWATVEYTEDMGAYCTQDVEITHQLLIHLMKKRGYINGKNKLALEENE